MLTERHFKNEDGIKSMIVDAHRRGVCDRNGVSIKTDSGYIAKPIFRVLSSVAKRYIYKKGKRVEIHG